MNATTPPVGEGQPCLLARYAAQLDADDRATLEAAVAQPQANASQIARALTQMGRPVSQPTTWRHIRRECSCYRARGNA